MWLFVGQLAASLGFIIYSYVLRNWVFVVTNALMALSAIIGVFIVVRQPSRTATSARDSLTETS